MLKTILTSLCVVIGFHCNAVMPIPNEMCVYDSFGFLSWHGLFLWDSNKCSRKFDDSNPLELREKDQDCTLIAKATYKHIGTTYYFDVVDGQGQAIGSFHVYDSSIVEFFSADGRQMIISNSYYTLWPHHGHWRTIFPLVDVTTLEEVAVFSYHQDQHYTRRAWFTVINREVMDATQLDYRVVALFMSSKLSAWLHSW